MKYVVTALAAAAMATSAHAVTITKIYTPGSNALPGYVTNSVIVQDFGTAPAGPNGTNFQAANPAFQAPATSQSATNGNTVRVVSAPISGIAGAMNPQVGNFLTILGGGNYTLNFGTTGVQVLSFLVGTLDSYNSVTLNFKNAGAVTLNGAAIINNVGEGAGGAIANGGRVTYDFGGTDSLLGVTFASSQAAFEIDQIAVAVPEPATWAMMICGFGLAGAQLRSRRRAKVTFARS
jgi:PEP-CTERM motif